MNVIRLQILVAGIMALLGAPPARANADEHGPAALRPSCAEGQAERPATPPARGRDSGTAPGGMGSTGWSGGTGGSHIGTSPSGATPASPEQQPRTARGLDPTRPSAADRRAPC